MKTTLPGWGNERNSTEAVQAEAAARSATTVIQGVRSTTQHSSILGKYVSNHRAQEGIRMDAPSSHLAILQKLRTNQIQMHRVMLGRNPNTSAESSDDHVAIAHVMQTGLSESQMDECAREHMALHSEDDVLQPGESRLYLFADGSAKGKSKMYDEIELPDGRKYVVALVDHHLPEDEGADSVCMQVYKIMETGGYDKFAYVQLMVDHCDPDVIATDLLLRHGKEYMKNPNTASRLKEIIEFEDMLDKSATFLRLDLKDPEIIRKLKTNATIFKAWFEHAKQNGITEDDMRKQCEEKLIAVLEGAEGIQEEIESTNLDELMHYSDTGLQEEGCIIINGGSGPFARMKLMSEEFELVGTMSKQYELPDGTIAYNYVIASSGIPLRNLAESLTHIEENTRALKGYPPLEGQWGGRNNVIGSPKCVDGGKQLNTCSVITPAAFLECMVQVRRAYQNTPSPAQA